MFYEPWKYDITSILLAVDFGQTFCGDPRLQHNSKRSVANTEKFMFMKCIY